MRGPMPCGCGGSSMRQTRPPGSPRAPPPPPPRPLPPMNASSPRPCCRAGSSLQSSTAQVPSSGSGGGPSPPPLLPALLLFAGVPLPPPLLLPPLLLLVMLVMLPGWRLPKSWGRAGWWWSAYGWSSHQVNPSRWNLASVRSSSDPSSGREDAPPLLPPLVPPLLVPPLAPPPAAAALPLLPLPPPAESLGSGSARKVASREGRPTSRIPWSLAALQPQGGQRPAVRSCACPPGGIS